MSLQTKGNIFLNVLLNRYHRGSFEDIYQMLPEEEAETLRSLSVNASDVTPALAQAKEQLVKLHYSWLINYIKQFPEQHHNIVIASLPEPLKEKIAKVMQLKLPEAPIPAHMQSFFLDKFYKGIPMGERLPAEFLPESPLTSLLSLGKKKLVAIIDLLGVYDFAESIRKIVDKRQLKSLTNCLSLPQQRFLRYCLHRKEKLSATKTVLEKWDRDPKTLRKTLHRRGLMRLGGALSNENPDFLWHLNHTLDTGRSSLLEKYCKRNQPTHVVEALIQQILNLLNYLEKKKP